MEVGRIVFLRLSGLLLRYILRPLKVSFCISISSIFVLMKVGIPIFLFSYAFNIANTFPKIILLKHSGMEIVGLFAPALALTTLFNIFPATLARYIYPNKYIKMVSQSVSNHLFIKFLDPVISFDIDS